MLRPRSYPALIGKALVLEAEPFETMADDDEPWAEGLVLILAIGLLVGVARLVGGLLLMGSLPPAASIFETILNGWQALASQLSATTEFAAREAEIRQLWATYSWLLSFDSLWPRLLGLVFTPLGLVIQWLVAGGLIFLAARAYGGRGSLNQTLGATALLAAPQVLLVFLLIPFVQVSGLLLAMWSLLILYRAVEVVHELPWQRAAVVAATPYALLILLALIGAGLAGIWLTFGGRI